MSAGEGLKLEVRLQEDLNKDLSKAIAKVLRKYGVEGQYIFNVRKDPDYGHAPIREIKGVRMSLLVWCLGSGAARTDDPTRIIPI